MNFFKLIFIVSILLTLLNADDFVYKSDQVRNLLLRNTQNDTIERTIYVDDMLLIDIIGDPRHYAGRFLGIQDNFIFISKNNILGYSIISIDINDIDAIYLGIGKTFQELRNRWGTGFAIALIPGSIQMAYTGPEPEVFSREAGALITWAFFGTMGYLFYGNIFGGIDYLIRKGKAQEFIIGPNGYFIDK